MLLFEAIGCAEYAPRSHPSSTTKHVLIDAHIARTQFGQIMDLAEKNDPFVKLPAVAA